MGSHVFRGLIGAFIAGSLIFSSSAAAAATTAIDDQVNPWAVLSAMSGGAPAAAMCGAAATAAAVQGPTGCVLPIVDAAPPPPVPAPPPPVPVEAAVPSAGASPLILGLLALAALVGAAVALSGHHHGNSPA